MGKSLRDEIQPHILAKKSFSPPIIPKTKGLEESLGLRLTAKVYNKGQIIGEESEGKHVALKEGYRNYYMYFPLFILFLLFNSTI